MRVRVRVRVRVRRWQAHLPSDGHEAVSMTMSMAVTASVTMSAISQYTSLGSLAVLMTVSVPALGLYDEEYGR